MEHHSFYLILSLSLCLSLVNPVVGAASDDMATKCSQVVQKVIPCLSFAQGTAAVPTKECCDATASIKASSPECMCYIIQQTHKGNEQSKSLGIKEERLLQLPSACKLKANVSDCPSKFFFSLFFISIYFSSSEFPGKVKIFEFTNIYLFELWMNL